MRYLALAALLGAFACTPSFDDSLARVATTKLLAVRSEPAEAVPGATVAWQALVASPDGTVASPALDWSLCLQPKPVVEANVVADACLGDGAAPPFALAQPIASTAIPSNVCQLFGPDLPPQQPGMPDTRPRVPDATGGYYQPVRVELAETNATTIALTRVRCNLLGASMPIAVEYRARYVPNRHPQLARLIVPQTIRVDETATLTVEWAPEAAETFVVFELTALRPVDRRETMQTSWYATRGALLHDRVGRDADDPLRTAVNEWRAPSTPGPATLWVVLRDDRGGVDWLSADVEILP